MTTRHAVTLDPRAAGNAFPPIHEGRYEVDPWATGLNVETLPQGLRDAARRTGLELLRIGIGCWLPSQDPDPATLHEREWFRGTTLADVENPDLYTWTHLDRNLDLCAALGVELLFCFDTSPASLARVGPQMELPDYLKPYAPEGYTFMDGVRNAPPADPAVYAAAALKVLEHIGERGVTVRYVELWNEPDLPFFYSGTFEEWWATYVAFAHAVHDAGYAVGGPSWAGALAPEDWLVGIAKLCVAEGVPLDFYSFHRYGETDTEILERCHQVRSVLEQAGLSDTKILLDEWGYDLRQAPVFGTVHNAVFVAACLMQFPAAGIADQTNILLIDPVAPEFGRFHGLTRQDGDPNPVCFAIEAFEKFRTTPRLLETGAPRVLAGVNDAGTRLQVVIANASPEPATYEFALAAGEARGTLARFTQEIFDRAGGYEEEKIELTTSSTQLHLAVDELVLVDVELA